MQIWHGDPAAGGMLLSEDFVGQTAEVIDSGHDFPDYTYSAHYLENNGTGSIAADWTPSEPGVHAIFVVVDPHGVLTEIDEANNVVERRIQVGFAPATSTATASRTAVISTRSSSPCRIPAGTPTSTRSAT